MESNLKYRILKWAKAEPDIWLAKYHGTAFSLRGHPDVYGCVGPFSVFLELKQPGKKLEKVQGAIGRKITRAGGFFECVDNFERFRDIVEELRERALDLEGVAV